MAHFGLNWLEKMFLGAWGYKAIKQVIDDRAPEKRINTGHYTTNQARFLVEVAMSSPNYVRWHRYMENEAGFTTNEIISIICHYTPEQFYYYFNVVKPI